MSITGDKIEPFKTRVEIHAADHCVQKCKYCSHAADTAEPRSYDPEDYTPLFEIMDVQGVNWDIITIVGGEPFLNPRLGELMAGVRPFGRLEVMTNCFWLRSEEDIDRYDEPLRLMNRLTVTLYKPIISRIGLKEFNRLINIIREKYLHLRIGYFHFGTKVQKFTKVEFYDDPRPIINKECGFRDCLQLMAEGYLMRCCASRRVPNHEAIDHFYIDGHIDKLALVKWMEEPIIDLCSYCNIATEGLIVEPWTLLSHQEVEEEAL